MIDWVTAILPCHHSEPIIGGHVVSIQQDGTIEWDVVKGRMVIGSYASNILVQTTGPNELRLSGNPVKWMQGHNLFGSDDLVGLVKGTMERLCGLLKLSPTHADLSAWESGSYRLSRVDCTAMWRLKSRADVRSYLRALEMQAKSRHGRPMSRGGTVYFGKNSRRWALKAYSKGDELDAAGKGHRLPADLPFSDELKAFADSTLRFELVLRAMALKDRALARASAWQNIDPVKLLQDAIGNLDMAETFSLSPALLAELPPRLILAYEAWASGKDLRQIIPTRTFYRYRKELLKRGIDINIRQPGSSDNVVPLVRAIRPEAMTRVPKWAEGTSIYYEPTSKRSA